MTTKNTTTHEYPAASDLSASSGYVQSPAEVFAEIWAEADGARSGQMLLSIELASGRKCTAAL